MRIAAFITLLVLTSPVHADSGTGLSIDVGYARSQVAVTDRTALDADVGRFALRISHGRFHWGGEVEEGSLTGTTALPGGAVARTSGVEGPLGPLGGNTLGLKLFAGGHVQSGPLMVGVDVLGGMRDSWVESDRGPDVAGRKNEPLLELRSRADVWLSSSLTLGVVASMDVLERRNVSLGAALALHFTR